ncbi:zeta-toxin [Capnocytophaga sp. oral taxon 338 str. F0234]|nr:zeta-toxin [Capnocytophaga sp. oral taxon 338 str. F0234]
MKMEEIEAIYLLKRDKLLREKLSQESPIAFILGGQPASGKSGLASTIP